MSGRSDVELGYSVMNNDRAESKNKGSHKHLLSIVCNMLSLVKYLSF